MSPRHLTFLTLGTILICAGMCCGQNLEDGWNGIRLLLTDKASIDSRLGAPEKITDNGYANYKTVDAFVQINYSSKPCSVDPQQPGIERGSLNIPKGTAFDMWILFDRPVKVAELKLDLSNFTRDTGGDVLDIVYYWGHKHLSIGGYIRNGTEYASKLIYRAVPADKKLFPRVQPGR